MDANRFDTLTRSMGAPASRRAALGATLAGGLLGALGLARTVPEARAAQRGSCTLGFSANVRLGPSVSQPLAAGEQAGALHGELSFDLDQGGRLENGVLQLPTGEAFPVVGQATGYAFQARIELAPHLAMVLVGVGEREVAACEGAIDGVVTGPDVGDLGDWHGAAAQQARGGGGGGNQEAAGDTARGGGRDREPRQRWGAYRPRRRWWRHRGWRRWVRWRVVWGQLVRRGNQRHTGWRRRWEYRGLRIQRAIVSGGGDILRLCGGVSQSSHLFPRLWRLRHPLSEPGLPGRPMPERGRGGLAREHGPRV